MSTTVCLLRTYRASDMATATLGLRIKSNGKGMIVRSLPAGMDIAPDAWRFPDEKGILTKFEELHCWMLDRHFEHVMSDVNTVEAESGVKS